MEPPGSGSESQPGLAMGAREPAEIPRLIGGKNFFPGFPL